MKKIFLLLSMLVVVTMSAMADMEEFDFVSDDFGLERAIMSSRMDMNGNALTSCINDWRKTLEFEQNGVQLVFSDKNADGKGYGLESNTLDESLSGLVAFAALLNPAKDLSTNPVVDITVPNCKIIGVKFYVGGPGITDDATECLFNDNVCVVKKSDNVYLWSFSNAGGVDKVTFTFASTPLQPRVFRKIEVKYQRDIDGKKICGLFFDAEETQAIVGQSFTTPTLSNPNNLSVTWSSSNEAVATVDASGNVTLVCGGSTNIEASTTGNDSYAEGSVSYKLTVIPSANNIPEMAEMAPLNGNRVYVNFPMTVTYPVFYNALLIDTDDNATELHNIKYDEYTGGLRGNIYKVGEVIPAGWMATNNIGRYHSHIVWNGLPADPTETVAVVYPVVEKLGYESDADRVAILKNVVFNERTQSGDDTKFRGTANGETYEFQNSYGAPAVDAGTYDVTVVVKYNQIQSTLYAYLAPIAFAESSDDDPLAGFEVIEAAGQAARYFGIDGVEIENPEKGIFIKVVDGKAIKVRL